MPKRVLPFVLVSLVFAGLALSQTGGISGWVYDAQTQRPIVGATVCCYFANAKTDSTGFYRICNLQPRKYKVRAMATGYETGYYPESVLVEPGRVTPDINFHLVPTSPPQHGGIKGKVASQANGQVIVGAVVKASGPNGTKEVIQQCQGYQIEGLLPGKYRVSATAQGFEPGHYRDSVLVVSGQMTPEICFHLVPSGQPGFGSIAGLVSNVQSNQPIPGAVVRASGPVVREVVQRGCCGYKVDSLPPGGYWVTAGAQGFRPGHYPESVMVVVGQIHDHVDIRLEPEGPPSGAIAGRVTNAVNGQVICRAVVKTAGPSGTRQVMQTCQGYRVGELPAGRYWVSAVAEGFEPGSYPESVLVEVGRTTEHIDFSLRPRGGGELGKIAGRVVNAETREPIVGAVIEVAGPSRGHATSNREGNFCIPSLLPGFYVLEADAPGYLPLREDSIKVTAGQVTELVLALRPKPGEPGGIAGTVRDSATGLPIPDAAVFAFGRAGSGFGFTDRAGQYVIRNLPPGSYGVHCGARGYYEARYPEPVEVVGGRVTDGIDFLLRRCRPGDAGISGFVFDAYNQNGIANARLTAIGEDGTWEVLTDENGDYLVDGLVPGEYLLMVEADGYSTELLPEPVIVEPDMVTSLVWPGLFPLTGIAEGMSEARMSNVEIVPNPATGATTVRWQVRTAGPVTLQVLDNAGRVVRTLVRGSLGPGSYTATWDRTDRQGRRVSAGIYFYRLLASGREELAKTVVVDR